MPDLRAIRPASKPLAPSPILCPPEREDEPSLRELVRAALILTAFVPLVDFATEEDGPSVKVTLLRAGFLESIEASEHCGDRPPPTPAPDGNSSRPTPVRLRELGAQATERLRRGVVVTHLRIALARALDAMLHGDAPCPLLIPAVREGLHAAMDCVIVSDYGLSLAGLVGLTEALHSVLVAAPKAWRGCAEELVALGAKAVGPQADATDEEDDAAQLASHMELRAVVRDEPAVAYWFRSEPRAAREKSVPVDFAQLPPRSRRQISMSHDTRTTNTVGTNRSRLSAQVAA